MNPIIAIFIWFFLGLSSDLAISETLSCIPLINGGKECSRRDWHPTGPTIFKELWLKNSLLPVEIHILGARSGCALTPHLQLKLIDSKLWVVISSSQMRYTLINLDESSHAPVQVEDGSGGEFEILVLNVIQQPFQPGIIFEYEPKLDLRLIRRDSSKKPYKPLYKGFTGQDPR